MQWEWKCVLKCFEILVEEKQKTQKKKNPHKKNKQKTNKWNAGNQLKVNF